MSIATVIKTGVSRGCLIVRKFAPEILTGAGIGLEVFAVVSAAKGTKKAQPVLDRHKEVMKNLNENTVGQMVIDDNGESTIKPVNLKKEKSKVYFDTTKQLARIYMPAIASTAASVACFGASLGIMRGRTAALTTAATLAQSNLKKYRERVADRFGEETERDIFYGTTTEEREDKEVVKNAPEETVKKFETDHSMFARFFDCGNENWSDIPEYNLMFLKKCQNWANDKLNAQGHLFLNEVYDYLGIRRSSLGATYGWLKTKDGSTHNYVDFGLFNGDSTPARMFINGEEPVFLLDFNVDGVIYDLI